MSTETPRTDHVMQHGLEYTGKDELAWLCRQLERDYSTLLRIAVRLADAWQDVVEVNLYGPELLEINAAAEGIMRLNESTGRQGEPNLTTGQDRPAEPAAPVDPSTEMMQRRGYEHLTVNEFYGEDMSRLKDRTYPEVPDEPVDPRPKIVCLCGSTRFYETWQEHIYLETMAGKIVLAVGFYPHTADKAHAAHVGVTPEQKIALDVLHKRKIDLADEVLVLNVCGYIGESTRSEIDYAVAHGKPVRYLEPAAPVGHLVTPEYWDQLMTLIRNAPKLPPDDKTNDPPPFDAPVGHKEG